ncbi:amyloid-beta A4 precursor protein-binding family B member 2-like isoform X2 [Anneissia japonica]|uniref:amyloid-beta A4 precursor protein-binding family B member 2-like isoform X2 n=1 Tax=Anneissia japonica TaxID=1529436 RepID=UPI0014258475|nr:amyloid-beta A4 precursor protein-binding family B member 2-like isoform X2 [Anneissia japonica]
MMATKMRLAAHTDQENSQLRDHLESSSLVNPSYNANKMSPSDSLNANSTPELSRCQDYEQQFSNLNIDQTARIMDLAAKKNGIVISNTGKVRKPFTHNGLVKAESKNMSDSEDEGPKRLTVADDNIIREQNKIKAEAMFADIEFIDDGDDDDEEEEDEEEDDDDDEIDCEIKKDDEPENPTKKAKILEEESRKEVEEIDEDEDDDDDEDEDDEDIGPVSEDEAEESDRYYGKDPDADVLSPEEKFSGSKLSSFMDYYAALESQIVAEANHNIVRNDDSDESTSDDSDVEIDTVNEGLYELMTQTTSFGSGPSTMDESSDTESTYAMLYKSFGLRSEQEGHGTKDLLSPGSNGRDHGYSSETSIDDKYSPMRQSSVEGGKPALSSVEENALSPSVELDLIQGLQRYKSLDENEGRTPFTDSSSKRPTSLPPGWEECADSERTYYWHVPTGITQWSPPSPSDDSSEPLAPKKPARLLSQSSIPSGGTNSDPEQHIRAFQESALRYASLNAGDVDSDQEHEEKKVGRDPIKFHVRSLGWVEMNDSDLSPGKSSLAVNNCIRQLSYRKNDIRDSAGIWGEGKDMNMVLEDEHLKLMDTADDQLLNQQHVCSIRVWGVGRDNGRDFAYVARDKQTKRYKCHVFRCDIPAKAIASALHEICSRVMKDRQKGNTISMVTPCHVIQQKRLSAASPDTTPTKVDFPTPKAEPTTTFRAHYLGCTPVTQPRGIETINEAVNKLYHLPEEDWIPVRVEVAISTITITNIKTKEIISESRIRFLSFLGIGPNIRQFGYIMCSGKNQFSCHVLCCEHSSGGLAKAIEAACKLRYQKCLDARPTGQQNQSDSKAWGSGIRHFFNRIGSFRRKNPPTAVEPTAV